VCCDFWRGSARRCVLLIQNYIFQWLECCSKRPVIVVVLKRKREKKFEAIHFRGKNNNKKGFAVEIEINSFPWPTSLLYVQSPQILSDCVVILFAKYIFETSVVPPMGFMGGFLCVACTKIKIQRLFFSV
jgi:hypothetical protein